jgi:hypothetical protein
MELTSRGPERNRKTKQGTPVTYFTDEAEVTYSYAYPNDDPRVVIRLKHGDNYKLVVSAEELIRAILKLPEESIAPAVAKIAIDEEAHLSRDLPDVIKQLVAGVLAAHSEKSTLR